MRIPSFLGTLLLVLAFGASARAQNGTLDQTSPIFNGYFDGNSVSSIWQCQVRAGAFGWFEGVTLNLGGSPGASVDVRLRAGAGWNTSAVLASGTAVKTSPNQTQSVFVNLAAGGLLLNVNDLFVIEIQGNGTGAYLTGSHISPPGPPLYPEPLFLNGPGCYGDCGARIAFQTYDTQPISSTCFGNGVNFACPCSNSGAPGRGCQNSASTGGSLLTSSGSTIPDTLVLTASGELPTALTIFLQGTSMSPTPFDFGDGLRCVSGVLKRLYVKSASGGTASAPGPGDPSITAQSAALGDPIVSGQTRGYQAYYRDSSASFCPSPSGGTFNVSNALLVLW
jgi:hypothetical protein